MPIAIRCPMCKRVYRFAERPEGGLHQCECGVQLRLPAAAAASLAPVQPPPPPPAPPEHDYLLEELPPARLAGPPITVMDVPSPRPSHAPAPPIEVVDRPTTPPGQPPIEVATCPRHPHLPVEDHCADCNEPVCVNCLIRFQDQPLCANCKNKRARKAQRPQKASALAYTAFGLGIPTLFCAFLGCLLGPAAIITGFLGLNAVEKDPRMRGRAHAISGIVLGFWSLTLAIVLFVMIGMSDPKRGR